jgi:hypothetical protein
MRIRRPLAAVASLFFLTVAVAVPVTAFADESGSAGSVDSVEINSPSADTYLQYHGRVFLRSGKSNKKEYRWGGTACGSRIMPTDMVEVLIQASRNDDILITPRFQTGQGDVKCLVGFGIEERR